MNLETIDFDKIPVALREFPTWVLWQALERDGKATKVPFQICGQPAKANDFNTWESFANVRERFEEGGFSGIGFVFTTDLAGIDLDGCRDPETGTVSDWAKEILIKFNSYAEVSPSKTGVKIFCRGTWGPGKKVSVDAPKVNDKEPGIEVYDRLRYFTVTGWRVSGPKELESRQEALAWLKETYFPDAQAAQPKFDFRSDDAVVSRARAYISKLPAAISGKGGHNATFHVACILVLGFQLSEAEAMGLMHEYNQRCEPVWTEKELLHKVTQAAKQPGERGYLRNAAVSRWNAISVPTYQEPFVVSATPAVVLPTLGDAATEYLEKLKIDKGQLVKLGIHDLDHALGGGVDFGEMVIFAARPSHGKSAVALQFLHTWTAAGMPCAMVSEEMFSLALGKRTLQFISPIHQEHWFHSVAQLENDIKVYKDSHAACYVLEGCGSAQKAIDGIDRVVKDHGVQCAVVDYAQLLQSPGKSRYEQVTNTSVALRQLASHRKIVLLVLVQASRDLDTRARFEPTLRDLKDTGQFEQDADVVVFLCWPHKIDAMQPRGKYQFFILKVRNREINNRAVVCHFNPARQTIQEVIYDVKPANIHSQNGGI